MACSAAANSEVLPVARGSATPADQAAEPHTLLSAQENDFIHFTGKIEFTPRLARDYGLRPIAIIWGALNLFGGGRSSQFLLEHPEGFQVEIDGSHRPEGCYVNPLCVGRIQRMIDRVASLGFEGYCVDEPTPLRDCYCPSCRDRYDSWYGGDLASAEPDAQEQFRERCVIEYVRTISDYCAANRPGLETICCLMPTDRQMWEACAQIESLHNLGTDVYWVNDDRDIGEMTPMVRDLEAVCKAHGKIHHEWLQCFSAFRGKEQRIVDQGRILIREQPDALYLWAWEGQVGTDEACEDPQAAWAKACEVLATAKRE